MPYIRRKSIADQTFKVLQLNIRSTREFSKMLKVVTLLVVTLMVISSTLTNAGDKLTKIDDYLVKNVQSDDVGQNLEAASNWLNEGITKNLLSMTPISDLKNFVALKQVVTEPKCDGSDFEIMSHSDQAVGLYTVGLFGQKTAYRRVEKVLLQIFTEHGKKCSTVYPAVYRTKKESLGDREFKRIATIANEVMLMDKAKSIGAFAEYTSTFLMYHWISQFGEITGQAVRNALLVLAKDDPHVKYVDGFKSDRTGKLEINEKEIKELTKRYMFEPCKNYVNNFGPDLFIPARADIRFYNEIDENNVDFYMGWSSFLVCQRLINNESAQIEKLVKAIKRANV